MANTPLIENRHDGGFIVTQANGHRSIDNIILKAGQRYLAGAVLGQITVAETATVKAKESNTGNGTITDIQLKAGITTGTYQIILTDATNFTVMDDKQHLIANGEVGKIFNTFALTFTVKAGAKAFVANDAFTLTIASGSGKWCICTAIAKDGSQNAAGILYATTDATLSDESATAITRDAEVNTSELIWDAPLSIEQQKSALAQLQALGIIAR